MASRHPREEIPRRRRDVGRRSGGRTCTRQTPPMDQADIDELVSGGRHAQPIVYDVEQLPDTPTCIDLTEADDTVEYVDLTSAAALPESPIVILSTSSDVGRRSTRSQNDSLIDLDNETDTVFEHSGIHEVDGAEPQSPDETGGGNEASSSFTPGRVITCPVCMDNAREIRGSGRTLMSTICGHIFCSTCINGAIDAQKKCPTCRKKLTKKQTHPIYL